MWPLAVVAMARNQDRRAAARRGAAVIEPIRVLIADDHPLFRDGLTALLTGGSWPTARTSRC